MGKEYQVKPYDPFPGLEEELARRWKEDAHGEDAASDDEAKPDSSDSDSDSSNDESDSSNDKADGSASKSDSSDESDSSKSDSSDEPGSNKKNDSAKEGESIKKPDAKKQEMFIAVDRMVALLARAKKNQKLNEAAQFLINKIDKPLPGPPRVKGLIVSKDVLIEALAKIEGIDQDILIWHDA